MNLFQKYKELKNSKKTPKIPAVETSFGQHSKEKKIPAVETSFGSHSVPKNVSEDKESSPEVSETPSAYKPFFRTGAEHAHIHSKVAPFNLDKVSNEGLASVVDYTDDSYAVNSGLFHHYKEGIPVASDTKEQIDHLTKTLNDHKTTEPTHVFTGTKFSPSQHFSPVKGAVPETATVHLPAFTSTSTSINKAIPFGHDVKHANDANHGVAHDGIYGKAKHILKIELPKGTSAASVREHAMLPSEQEILLNRGHTIEIHKDPVKLDSGTYLWNAKIKAHNPEKLS
jgi:hypothetical protein